MNVQDVQAKETAKYPEIWLGNPYPLGATWTEEAVNFAVFSETASAVDLCLFDSIEGAAEQVRIHMTEQTDQSLARCGPGPAAGPALWLSRLWILRAGAWSAFQQLQAVD
jgi:pullulanase/glycogen debranching enzyme